MPKELLPQFVRPATPPYKKQWRAWADEAAEDLVSAVVIEAIEISGRDPPPPCDCREMAEELMLVSVERVWRRLRERRAKERLRTAHKLAPSGPGTCNPRLAAALFGGEGTLEERAELAALFPRKLSWQIGPDLPADMERWVSEPPPDENSHPLQWAVFRQIDTSGDGTLQPDEIVDYLRDLGHEAMASELISY
eukprot:SAG31_NODE_14720_length_791_cov_0.823699_1_plen_193_part_10